MEVMGVYHARVDRDGRFWRVYVPEIDRVTQARHLREVEEMARDLVAVMDDVEPDAFELVVTYRLPTSVEEHLARAKELRQESDRARAEAAAESRAAVHELVDAGLPLRDIGRLLDLSYQRVHQLAADRHDRRASQPS